MSKLPISSMREQVAQDIGFTRDCSSGRNTHRISEGKEFLVDSRNKSEHASSVRYAG